MVDIRPAKYFKSNTAIFFKIYQAIIYFLLWTMFITCIGDLFCTKNWMLIVENLLIIIGMSLVNCKYVFYSYKYDELHKIIETVSNLSIKDKKSEERYDYLKIHNKYTIIEMMFIFMFLVLTIVLYLNFILFYTDEEATSPFRAVFPFDTTDNIYGYWFANVLQIIAFLYYVFIMYFIDIITGVLWHQIALNYLILAKEFEDMKTYCKKKVNDELELNKMYNKRLRILIIRHQFMIQYTEDVNTFTNPTLSYQIIANNLILCLSGFVALLNLHDMSLFLKFAVYAAGSLGQLGYFCLMGDLVTSKSSLISDRAYSILENCEDKTLTSNLYFIIIRSQKPIAMYVFSMCFVNLPTYLNRTWSYCEPKCVSQCSVVSYGIMFRVVRLRIRNIFLLLFGIVLNNIRMSHMANNHMDISTKDFNLKNQSNVNTSFIAFTSKTYSDDIQSLCPSNLECERLTHPCIKCNMTNKCIYGKQISVNCSVFPEINCVGKRDFEKQTICRYCYQTEHWEHKCVQRGSCNSVGSPRQYYATNCTVLPDIICLGKREFLKNVLCNWTGGARWSTALILSITLGGFGADRFYLGHWQEGIGKLFSFGGLGVWTLLDVVLISIHHLGPADGSLYI